MLSGLLLIVLCLGLGHGSWRLAMAEGVIVIICTGHLLRLLWEWSDCVRCHISLRPHHVVVGLLHWVLLFLPSVGRYLHRGTLVTSQSLPCRCHHAIVRSSVIWRTCCPAVLKIWLLLLLEVGYPISLLRPARRWNDLLLELVQIVFRCRIVWSDEEVHLLRGSRR